MASRLMRARPTKVPGGRAKPVHDPGRLAALRLHPIALPGGLAFEALTRLPLVVV